MQFFVPYSLAFLLSLILSSFLPLSVLAAETEREYTEETLTPTVTTSGWAPGANNVYRPSTTLRGDELQRNLSSSVPATLEAVPGFHVQYNGPGAANPTIRGMPGDRILMLEDGHTTGDIYWTASDHGVMVEPLSAERIDVLRGPAGLLYGSNALGGVVNVIREDIPIRRPHSLEGVVSSQFESVNRGFTLGGALRAPLGEQSTVYAEATGRRAGDTRTPLGPIEKTDLQALNGALGFSWRSSQGLLGAALRYYENVYGVPGEFDGQLIPGGHPGGVSIEATRIGGRIQGEYHRRIAFFDGLQLRSNFTHYLHDEIEGILGDQEVLGARFRQNTSDTHLIAHHEPAPLAANSTIKAEGALGLSFQSRDLVASGASPGTRSGSQRSLGLFGYEEFELLPFRIQTGLRYDFRHLTTDDLSPIRVRTAERRIVKEVHPRAFQSLSGSLAALYDFADRWTLGLNLARSFRPPTIEELYSDGPHLADFSYDIGSPDLSAEVGHGLDLFLRSRLPKLDLEVAAYINHVSDYIHYAPTGETIRVFREGQPPRVTPVFEARSDDALFLGAEGRIQWEFFERFSLDLSASYTRASRQPEGDPLPYIPPLSSRLEARYDGASFFASLGANLGAPQNRVPRPIAVGDLLESPQNPTDGYALMHALVGWRHHGDHFDHTLILQGSNLANQPWRDHLSRIKDVAPQPGRNLQISYRALF